MCYRPFSNNQLNFFYKIIQMTVKLHANILWALIKKEGILTAQNKQNIVHSPTHEGSLVKKTEVCKEPIFLSFYEWIY